jgi:hypothetical protein
LPLKAFDVFFGDVLEGAKVPANPLCNALVESSALPVKVVAYDISICECAIREYATSSWRMMPYL